MPNDCIAPRFLNRMPYGCTPELPTNHTLTSRTGRLLHFGLTGLHSPSLLAVLPLPSREVGRSKQEPLFAGKGGTHSVHTLVQLSKERRHGLAPQQRTPFQSTRQSLRRVCNQLFLRNGILQSPCRELRK